MSASLALPWPPRANSARSFDRDGRMHVTDCPITKACVSGYLGREIPRANELGLDPDRVYDLLRAPSELLRSFRSFNSLPILLRHSPVNASQPQASLIIGATGTDATWRAPFIFSSIVIWDGGSIAAIESDQVREISAGYHYTAVMTPGVFQGVKFAGIMTQIAGNHVAIVENGRVGSDCAVPD
jgi:hypothetical protein